MKTYFILSSVIAGKKPNIMSSPMGIDWLKNDFELFYFYWVHKSESPEAKRIITYTGNIEGIRFHVPRSIWKNGNPEDYIEVVAEKRNEHHLKQLIQQKLGEYLFYNSDPQYLKRVGYDEDIKEVNDRTPELFALQQKAELEVFRKYLCPNYDKPNRNVELKIFEDLRLYEKYLNEIVENRATVYEKASIGSKNEEFRPLKVNLDEDIIQKWIDRRVTLSEWLDYEDCHWDELDQCELDEETIQNIESHQLSLFDAAVKNKVHATLEKLLFAKQPTIRKGQVTFTYDRYEEAIKHDLSVIDKFLRGDMDEANLVLLNFLIQVRPEQYYEVLQKYQNVSRNILGYFDNDMILKTGQSRHSRNNSKFRNTSYFIAKVVYEYKLEITKRLDECNADPESTILPLKKPQPEPTNTEQATSLETVNPLPKSDEQLALKDLFMVEDWQKYFDVLTMCEPKLLEKKDTEYKFVGNQYTERGIVAGWAKYLKLKRIIDAEMNRDIIAATLSASIENFSVVGSSIDNQSNKYKKMEDQLIDLLNNN